jgi:plastocyanin
MHYSYSKSYKNLKISMLLAFSLLFGATTFATTITIQVANYSFSPSQVNCHVGDTIRWIYVNGNHTTTSTTIPNGAATWDSPMSPNVTEFKYKVTVAGQYGFKCSFHSNMTGLINASTVTGINSLSDKQNTLIVSPNPFQRNVNINFKNYPSSKQINIQVYDIIGKQVISTKVNDVTEDNYTLDLDELNPGMYFLYVIGDAKKDIFRIIKSNQN